MAETAPFSPAVAVLTPALRRLLLVGGGLMAVNSLYLLAVTLTERLSGALLKDEFVGWMSAAKSTCDRHVSRLAGATPAMALGAGNM
jgi:hypothetical protein